MFDWSYVHSLWAGLNMLRPQSAYSYATKMAAVVWIGFGIKDKGPYFHKMFTAPPNSIDLFPITITNCMRWYFGMHSLLLPLELEMLNARPYIFLDVVLDFQTSVYTKHIQLTRPMKSLLHLDHVLTHKEKEQTNGKTSCGIFLQRVYFLTNGLSGCSDVIWNTLGDFTAKVGQTEFKLRLRPICVIIQLFISLYKVKFL